MLPCLRIIRVVREIVIHEIGVIGKQSLNAGFAFSLCFVGFYRGVRLHLFAVLLPSA